MHCETCGYDLCLDCSALPTCTGGHKYAVFEHKIPEYEESGKDPKCHVCKSTEIKNEFMFFHCSLCEEEICRKCMGEKGGNITAWVKKSEPE